MDAHRSIASAVAVAVALRRRLTRLARPARVVAMAAAAATLVAVPTASLAQSAGARPGDDTFRVVESHTSGDGGRLVATVALPERLRAEPPASDALRVVADGNPVEASIDAVAPGQVAVAAVLDDAASVDETSLTTQRGLLAEFFLQVDPATPIVLASSSNGVIAGPSTDRRVLLQALAQLPPGGERDAVGNATEALDALETDGPKGLVVMTLGPDAAARDATALATRIESEGTLARWIDGSARATSVPEPLDSLAVPSVLTTAAVLPILDQLAADLGGQYRIEFSPVASAAATSVELRAGGEQLSAALAVPAATAPSTTATSGAPASTASPASTVAVREAGAPAPADASAPTSADQAAPAGDGSDSGLLIGVVLVGVGLLLAALAGFLLLRQRRASTRSPAHPAAPVRPATAPLPAAGARPTATPSPSPAATPVAPGAGGRSARAQPIAPAAASGSAGTAAPPPRPPARTTSPAQTVAPPPPLSTGAKPPATQAAAPPPRDRAKGTPAKASPPPAPPPPRRQPAGPAATGTPAHPVTPLPSRTPAEASSAPAHPVTPSAATPQPVAPRALEQPAQPEGTPAVAPPRASAAATQVTLEEGVAPVDGAAPGDARPRMWPQGSTSLVRSDVRRPTTIRARQAPDGESSDGPGRRTTWSGPDGATTGPRPAMAERTKSSHPKRSTHARPAGALLSPRTGTPARGGPESADGTEATHRAPDAPGLDRPLVSSAPPSTESAASAPAEPSRTPVGSGDRPRNLSAEPAPLPAGSNGTTATTRAHDLGPEPALTNGTPSTSAPTMAGSSSHPANGTGPAADAHIALRSPNGNGTSSSGAQRSPAVPADASAPESTGAHPIGGYRQCRRASPARESHAHPLGRYRTV